MTNDPVTYRTAIQDDETHILDVLNEVAPEIPLSIDKSDSQDPIRSIIIQCRKSEKSWVAVDAHGKIIGFVLAKPDMHEPTAISLPYIGVSKNSRRRGIFTALMEKLKASGVPLTARVLQDNSSGMADNLLKIGFTKVKPEDPKEARFRPLDPTLNGRCNDETGRSDTGGVGSICPSTARLRYRLDGMEIERTNRSKLGCCIR
jgi:ribosomal protein S18 acetylase RimI-like enzyme